MQNEVLALIVTYGQDPANTISFQTLAATSKSCTNVRLVVWDNSPVPQHNSQLAAPRFEQVTYMSTPENVGLSTIYNCVIKEHLRLNEYLLLLDQDSSIPFDFFEKFAQQLIQYPEVDLFLPTIKANERLVSPLPYFYGWGRYWKVPQKGIQASKFRSAINSGMLISARYLKGDFLGYDERLRFYGTDTQFMVSYAKDRNNFIIMDAIIHHDLSFFSSSSRDRLAKFLEMRGAYACIYEKNPFYERCLNAIVMIVVSVVYAIRQKSLSFLKSK